MLNLERPSQRLIVAADFDPHQFEDRRHMLNAMMALADNLAGTGVIIKFNALMRDIGYSLIPEFHDRGLGVFADLKLNDIPQTMAIDGRLLAAHHPDLVTVMCSSGLKGMKALKDALGDETELLGVTVLTSLNDRQCCRIHGQDVRSTVAELAFLAREARIDGLILSPKELDIVSHLSMTKNCPSIRPKWAQVAGDDQNLNRSMTPKQAILAGADRIVVGRPITGNPDQRQALGLTIAEIQEALDDLGQAG